MKIAVWHNLPSGGGKRALYHHVKGLLARGHTVEAWCPPTADQTYLPLKQLIHEHVVPLLKTPPQAKAYWGKLVMDKHCKQCAEEINKGGFDVLFANCCIFYRVTSIARYVKIPKVLYLEEPYRWLYEAMPELPWMALPQPNGVLESVLYPFRFLFDLIKVQGLRVLVREEVRNARAFDLILVNSLFSRESVLRAYGLDAQVCYLGIDCELFKPSALDRENVVVGLGGIYPGKGLERAVRAIGTISKDKRPDLVWIGNFSVQHYQQKVEELAVSLGVRFIPKVNITNSEVVHFLSRASVMIYTSVLEPFGFAPLEANACETPVAAIAEGGVRETIQHGLNGFLVDGAEPVSLGKVISRFLEDPKLAYRIGKQARKHVLENWSWDKAIDRLEKHLWDAKRAEVHS